MDTKAIWEHFPDKGENYYAAFDTLGHFKDDAPEGVVPRRYLTQAVGALKKTIGLANLWDGDDRSRDWAEELDALIIKLEEA